MARVLLVEDDHIVRAALMRSLADRGHTVQAVGTALEALRRVGRTGRDQPTVIEAGGLKVDVAQRQASLDDKPLTLTRKEFDLLAYLAARPGRVVSRRELLEEVWRQPSVGEDQTIDVHLYWLRRKLGESAAAPRYLHTVRGVGFKFTPPD